MTTTLSTTATAYHKSSAQVRAAKSLLLLIAPVATAAFLLAHNTLHILREPFAMPAMMLVFVVLAWSPLFFSFSALLTQSARDEALPRLGGKSLLHPGNVLRGILLMPYLVFAPKSKMRAEATASLLGWAAGVYLVAQHLGTITMYTHW